MKSLRKKTGFTLMETIVVLAIFITASVIISGFIITVFKANRFALQQSDAVGYANRGVDIMVKEIREASPAENGSFPIELADDQEFIFYSDTDSDELVERIRYYIEDLQLKKSVREPSGFPPVYNGAEEISIISEYVRNNTTPIFYYYNSEFPADTINNPLITPAAVNDITLVRVLLEVNVDPVRAPEHVILISNSQIRNLKDNL